MTILEWCVLGAISLGILVFCARIMRKGLTTLDDDRKHIMERIHDGEKNIEEDRKKISAQDQIYLLKSAMEDLIRLEDKIGEYSIQHNDNVLELCTPAAKWSIILLMREKNLRSAHKVLHGKSRWVLIGPDIQEEHMDPASIMCSLNNHLHGSCSAGSPPEHLARRLGGIKAVARKFQHL